MAAADPIIDAATFAELQARAGADFVDELVDTFLEEAPQMLAELRAAQALGPAGAERFRRAAHSLKSNGLTFGATRARGEGARRSSSAGCPVTSTVCDGARRRVRAAPPRPCRHCAMAEQGARLLVADDNKVNRLLLRRSLEIQGHRVSCAENGRIALEMLRSEPYDLLLLDMEMPEIDGFQVLEQLAARPALRDLPVIVTSSLEGVATVVRCIELGADDYLHKPVNAVLLRARINTSLEKKRLRDQQDALVRRFATSEVAQDMAESGFALGGRRVQGSVMFSDIRDFTALVESQPPEETIELLNAYYALMFDAINGRGGVVNQMIGDGLMAIFGAPLPLPDHAAPRRSGGARHGRDDRALQRRARAPPASRRSASASAWLPARWSPATPAPSSARPTPASATR